MRLVDSLKEWLSVAEASNYISNRTKEIVSENDLIDLAVEKVVPVYYNFNGQHATALDRDYTNRKLYEKLSPDYDDTKMYPEVNQLTGQYRVLHEPTFMAGLRNLFYGGLRHNALGIEYVANEHGEIYRLSQNIMDAGFDFDENVAIKGVRIKKQSFLLKRDDLDDLIPKILESQALTTSIQPENKPLTTRERETFLKIILGMAIKGYAYNPDAARNTAVSDIQNDMAELGFEVSNDTIREKLKEAKMFLPVQEDEKA